MKKEKVICIHCRDYVNYTVTEVDDVCIFRGESIPYVRKDPLCDVCGNIVFVEEIEDYNVQEPLRLYKKDK